MKLMKISKTFTLIELILVVAIVALLAAVMIPVITSARQKARVARIIHLADTLTIACRLYNSDTGGYAGECSYPIEDASKSLSANDSVPGWDGPYIEKALSNRSDPWIGSMCVVGSMLRDFDLDGDGTVDKTAGTPGNSIEFTYFQEDEAKAINDLVDKHVPGGWRVTGKVKWDPFFGGRAIIYLIGGS